MANSKKPSQTEYKCVACGEVLTETNCRPANKELSRNGLSPYCVSCESYFFDKLAEKIGRPMALFHCCVKFDVPCKPFILAGMENEIATIDDLWLTYIDKMEESGKTKKGEKILGFLDGETGIRNIFGRVLGQDDFGKYFEVQRKKNGTEEQRQRWGIRKEANTAYTTDDYEELDRLYANQVDKYKGQTITPAMDDIIVAVVKLTQKRDTLTEKGNIKGARDIQSMISTMLADENMRKKDEKPQEQLRIDSLVVALERDGLLEDGKFLGQDDMLNALRERYIKGKKYNYSLDVADQIIIDNYNTMRINADRETATEIPEGMEVEDTYGEFEKFETPEEKERKQFANLITLREGVTPTDKDINNNGEKKKK